MPHADLLELPLFSNISLDHLASFLSYWQPQAYPTQTYLLQQAVPPETNHQGLFLLIRGRVQLSHHQPNHPPLIVSQLQQPTLLGLIEFCCNTSPLLSVQATTPVELFFLPKTTFESLASQHHPALLPFALQLLQLACAQLAYSTSLVCQTCSIATLEELRQQWLAQQRSWVAEIFAQSQF